MSNLFKILLLTSSLLVIIVQTNITVAIIGTNDIHGTAFPANLSRSDDLNKTYLYGGLMYMGRLIQIIKNQYAGNVLYLDAGDQFQGGIQSSKLVSSGKIMNDFYDSLELNGSAIGNHQFDFGPDFLLPFMSSKQAPNIAANIRSQTNKDVFLPKQQISHVYELKSGIRIGVIGLSTVQTLTTTNAFKQKLFPQYKFLDYAAIVEQQSKKLKKKGVNAVLLVTHVGNECPLNLKYGIWTEKSQQNSCQVGDQMSKLINALPTGTIDGVLQGHRHVIAHHFQKGIPYMGSINGGYYFNVMYLTFNTKKEIINKTIQGPIPVCQKVFQNVGRCNYLTKHEIVYAGNLVPWRFHNQQVYAHPKVKAIFQQQWAPKMNPYFEEVVKNQIQMKISYKQQNALANVLTTVAHKAYPAADFVIFNSGGFRTQWLPGIIQYQNFYNMFPFDNILKSFDITGQQLLDTLKIIQNGDLSFYHTYGIQQNVTFNTSSNKTGFISAKWMNGSDIEPDVIYKGLTTDFILNGGDDFSKVIGKIYTPRNVRNVGDLKAILRPELQKLQVIRQADNWVDPQNPRLIVNKIQ